MLKRMISLLLLLACVAALATGCSNPVTTETGPRILRIDESDLGYPAFYTVSSRGRGFLLTTMLFDTLTWKDENGLVPLLAKEWDVSDDFLRWEFTLVENAKFTDDTPLTAEDVKFSFDYIKQHPHPWVSLNMVKETEVLDTYKVAITLNDIYAPFITEVAGNVPILPKHIFQDVNDPATFNGPEAVIGSGPFKLVKYDVAAGTYEFAANPDYFLGKPVVDQLFFAPVDQPGQALAGGELDVAQRVRPAEAQQFRQEGKFEVMEGPGLWVFRMYFNFNRPELKNTALRQALYYAIDRDELVEKAASGRGLAGNPGHIHPSSEWYNGDVKQYEFSPAKANEILDQAGITDKNGDGIREYQGKPLNLELIATSDREKEATMIESYLREIGVGLTVKLLESKTLEGLINEGSFTMALNGHGSFGGDPVLLARFASQGVGATPGSTTQGGGNWGNARFNELYASQIRELDQVKRQQQVAEMQQLIAEELPTLTLYYTINTFAYNPEKLNGWFYTKDGVSRAVPTVQNKLVYIKGTWGK